MAAAAPASHADPAAATADGDANTALLKPEGRKLADTAGSEHYYDADFSWIKVQSVKVGAQRIFPYVCKVADVMDSIGGVVARGLGLTNSRFQYAVDEYYRRERRKLRKEEQERQREMQRKREEGLLDEDDEALPYCPPIVTQRVKVEVAPPAAKEESTDRHDV